MARGTSKTKSRAVKVRHVPPEQRVSHRFFLIAKRLDQTLATMHARKFAISVTNWKIMRVIACSGPLSATELGSRTSLDPDKITRAIDTLVQRSYVVRRDDEADRRRVVLTLSAKGKRVYDKIDGVAGAIESEFLSVLTAEERRALLSTLDKLDQYSGMMFGWHDGGHERRHLAGMAFSATKLNGRSAKPVTKSSTKSLIKSVTARSRANSSSRNRFAGR